MGESGENKTYAMCFKDTLDLIAKSDKSLGILSQAFRTIV